MSNYPIKKLSPEQYLRLRFAEMGSVVSLAVIHAVIVAIQPSWIEVIAIAMNIGGRLAWKWVGVPPRTSGAGAAGSP